MNIMYIYLSVIWTYLSVIITILIYLLVSEKNKTVELIRKNNEFFSIYKFWSAF